MADIYSAPRGKNEDEWLDVAEHLVRKLAILTTSRIWIGAYWGECADESTSFGCRLRSRQPLPGVVSDTWEAALGVTGNNRGTWADVFAFPFLDAGPRTKSSAVNRS